MSEPAKKPTTKISKHEGFKLPQFVYDSNFQAKVDKKIKDLAEKQGTKPGIIGCAF